MSLKNKLYQKIELIKDPDIQKFVKKALDNADPKFWISPSSSTGKYHPPEDNGRGGLVRHTIKNVEITSELATFYCVSQSKKDTAIAGAILHDICKGGIPWGEHTDPEHGYICANFISQFYLEEPAYSNIVNCVRWHMHQWVGPKETLVEKVINPVPIDIKIVQLADYFASRECASFLPGINLSEKQIKNYGYSALEKSLPIKDSLIYYYLEKYIRNMKALFKKILKENIK